MTIIEGQNLVTTEDGSHTLIHSTLGEKYHSIQGAITESSHIFMGLGLLPLLRKTSSSETIRIFEMGFGTGLNALLSSQLATIQKRNIHYVTAEAFPISHEQSRFLNYDELLGTNLLKLLHEAEWGRDVKISEYFTLRKLKTKFEEFAITEVFDVVFYDAFSPNTQPELWTREIFKKVIAMLKINGVLVTYSSKSSVRKALKSAGFHVEKHPGPGKKREVVRAIKLDMVLEQTGLELPPKT